MRIGHYQQLAQVVGEQTSFDRTRTVVVCGQRDGEQWRRVRDVLAPRWNVHVVSLDGAVSGVPHAGDPDIVVIVDVPRSVAAGELVAELRRAFGSHRARPSRPRQAGEVSGVCRREGEYWSIEHGGTSFRLRHCKGLDHLARLLSRPHTEVHALMLAMMPFDGVAAAVSDTIEPWRSGLGDAGPALDPGAKSAYRRRLEQLDEMRDDARRFGDHGRVQTIEAEMDAIAHELASAIGLGGRDRRAAAPAERARVNVTRTIKAAIMTIARYAPALARHLRASVRTGTYCCYAPLPDAGVSWLTG
jgi:hypothetical protein